MKPKTYGHTPCVMKQLPGSCNTARSLSGSSSRFQYSQLLVYIGTDRQCESSCTLFPFFMKGNKVGESLLWDLPRLKCE